MEGVQAACIECNDFTMTRNTRHIILRLSGIALAIALLTLGITACSGSQADAEDIPVQESDMLTPDSVDAGPAVPKHLSFHGPEEIHAFMAGSPDSARFRRGIMWRLAETAPEYAESLLNSHSRRFLVCDKGKMRVFVYDSCGVEQASFKMAAGKKYGNKHKKGDCRTPEGFFRVEGVYNSTEWLYTDDDGVTSDVKGQYGPRFIRIKTQPHRWPIGIHGTCAPWSVGGRRSHGCMRLNNDDIMALVEYVEKGMPVIISPGSKDQRVNLDEASPTRRVWTGGEPLGEVRPSVTAKDSVTGGQNVDGGHDVGGGHVEEIPSRGEPEHVEPDSVSVSEGIFE